MDATWILLATTTAAGYALGCLRGLDEPSTSSPRTWLARRARRLGGRRTGLRTCAVEAGDRKVRLRVEPRGVVAASIDAPELPAGFSLRRRPEGEPPGGAFGVEALDASWTLHDGVSVVADLLPLLESAGAALVSAEKRDRELVVSWHVARDDGALVRLLDFATRVASAGAANAGRSGGYRTAQGQAALRTEWALPAIPRTRRERYADAFRDRIAWLIGAEVLAVIVGLVFGSFGFARAIEGTARTAFRDLDHEGDYIDVVIVDDGKDTWRLPVADGCVPLCARGHVRKPAFSGVQCGTHACGASGTMPAFVVASVVFALAAFFAGSCA